MKEYLETLKKVKLFVGVDEKDIIPMLSCLGARTSVYEKNRTILYMGDKVEYIGIVLSGVAHIERISVDGERVIIATLSECDFFAEALACAGAEESRVSVVADSSVTVLKLDFTRLVGMCGNACSFHSRLINNMLRIISRKNIYLQERLDVIARKTIRQKIFAYLETLPRTEKNGIVLPLSRDEMADFLCADRSALSHELSRMKKEGLIDFKKNRFTIK